MGDLQEVNVDQAIASKPEVGLKQTTEVGTADNMKAGNKPSVQNHHKEKQEDVSNIYLYLTILAGLAGVAGVVWFPTSQILTHLKVLINILEKPQFRVPARSGSNAALPFDCYDIQQLGENRNGVYKVFPSGMKRGIEVYCNMTVDGGGWMTIQRRQDGKTDFSRPWYDYQIGFGDVRNEFWLGNEFLHKITSQGWYELRVDMTDFNGKSRYAKYKMFSVANNENRYRLTVDGYSGDAGDSLGVHNKMMFTTTDNDNDNAPGNCAISFRGGFWYNNCHSANPNGFYFKGGKHESLADGINWHSWRGYKYSMKTFDMKIRPV